MCGFAGFIEYESAGGDAAARRRVLVSMGEAIAHRGPDDVQYYDDGTLALVFRRLSIIDPETGRQPFFNERRDALVVANGEIYNHLELRRELEGPFRFRSRSDCEVLLHGFERWGVATLNRVSGMFALAHWDLAHRRLTLARDRFGIKPLYVCRLPAGVLFGSELKALLAHPQCPRSLAWSDIERPLCAQPIAASYVDGVELLDAAGWLAVDVLARRARSGRYWRLEDSIGTAPFGDDAQAYLNHYAELLGLVTEQHLHRDVGAALLLSGGADSSLLAAVAAARGTRLPCFTIAERTSFLEGDVESARRLCQRLALPWVPVKFDYRALASQLEFDLERFEEAIWMMDSPRFDLEWIYKSALHQVIRSHDADTKVVLLGQGADEFAGGYSRRIDTPYERWSEYLAAEVADQWRQHQAARVGATGFGQRQVISGDCSPYHRFMLLVCGQLHHHNLWHEDRTSSWHSLEARVPFLDHRLVELLASVPAALHESLFWDKRIVRAALERFAPGFTLPQPKIGFLHGKDPGSLDLVAFRILQSIAPAFGEKYLRTRGGPFEPDKVQGLIKRALQRGPGADEALYQALKCISVCVFERQLRDPPIGWRAPANAPLPVMSNDDWDAWGNAMPQPVVCRAEWHPAQRVFLQENVRIAFDGNRVLFQRGGELAGRFFLLGSMSWEPRLLRNLANPMCAGFTVQDWMDELEIGQATLTALLDLLVHMGVLATGWESAAEVVCASLAAGE